MLDKMDEKTLKSRLIEDGYADNDTTAETAKRLLSFKGRAAQMLDEWLLNETMPHFEPIDGVGSDFLLSKLKMKAPALIIAYAMLEADPLENSNYFKHLSENIIGFYPPKQK